MQQHHVLVADDDFDATFLLQRAFAMAAPQLRVTYAENGQMLLDYLQGRIPHHARSPGPPPEMLLLDLKMVRVDGFQVLSFLKQNPGLRPKCIIIFSTSGEPADRARAAELGADAYLVKPAAFKPLLEIIERIAIYLNSGTWPADCPANFHLFHKSTLPRS